MLFSEIYGSYFNVVAVVLVKAAEGTLTEQALTKIAMEKAFAESTLSIPAALKSGSWPLIKKDLSALLRHSPTMPLTTLQKRWLKSLLSDPRIALFSPDTTGLEEVRPLFSPDTFVFFDRYEDGDPYGDPNYIKNFRMVLVALEESRKLKITFQSRTGAFHTVVRYPCRLEYSQKDDKFRLQTAGGHHAYTINIARIYRCELLEQAEPPRQLPDHRRQLTLTLLDRRNALERVLLHFSHLQKETRRLDDHSYRLTLWYDPSDETELLIRVLSFGPMVKVTGPERFVGLMRERITKQAAYNIEEQREIH